MSGSLFGTPFVAVPNWLVQSAATDKALRLYLVLQGFINAGTDGQPVAWPDRTELANRLVTVTADGEPRASSLATVDRAIASLEEVGAIVVDRRPLPGVGRVSNNYYLCYSRNDAPAIRSHLAEGERERVRDVKARPRICGQLAADLKPASRESAASYRNKNQGNNNQGNLITPSPPASGGPDPSPPDAVRQVFEAWLSSTGRSGRTVLDDKRRRLIAKALDRYPLADVLDAVRGWEHSAFHRGHNERGRPFNDLGLLLRDAQHIEQFRDAARGPREPDPGPGGRPRPAIDAVMKDRSKPSGRVIL